MFYRNRVACVILYIVAVLTSLVLFGGYSHANPTWPRNPTDTEIAQAAREFLDREGPAIKEYRIVKYHDKRIQPVADGYNANEVQLFFMKKYDDKTEFGGNRLEGYNGSWHFSGGGCWAPPGSPSFSSLGEFVTWCLDEDYYGYGWVSGQPPSQNRPPTVRLSYSPANPAPNDTIYFHADAADPDGDPLTYRWFLNDVEQTRATAPNVQWANPTPGTHTMRVVVSDGKGGMAEDEVEFTVAEEKLSIEINIGEGQRFTQGDDFTVLVLVYRGKQPVAEATVQLFVSSPNNQRSGPVELKTDENGQAEWRAYFIVDATVGIWKIEASTKVGQETAILARQFELVKLDVSQAQVQENIETIVQLWKMSKEVPNGVDQPFIAELWWPKGFKVDLYEWTDARFKPYTCSALAIKTLRFLNSIRFSPLKDKRLLMAGVDYGPINDGTGLIHVAVALYPKPTLRLDDQPWTSGYVLEPWYNQKKEAWSWNFWALTFLGGDIPGNNWVWGNLWAGEYPTTGSDGGYYPQTEEVPPSLTGPNKTRVLTYSPVMVLLTDVQGRRVGRLPDGTFINEIPGAEQSHAVNDDGTFASMISAPDGQYQVSINGTANGKFHLVVGTDSEIVHYGEHPIRAGEQATLTLKSSDLRQPLKLPNGSLIAPQPGLPEEDSDGAPPPPPPGGTKTIEQALDQNNNKIIDDFEMLQALQYWIKQQIVPDTNKTIDDLTMLALLQKWIKGTPIQ